MVCYFLQVIDNIWVEVYVSFRKHMWEPTCSARFSKSVADVKAAATHKVVFVVYIISKSFLLIGLCTNLERSLNVSLNLSTNLKQ
jgi:hypothetical protein